MSRNGDHRNRPSFPTRRSSDLRRGRGQLIERRLRVVGRVARALDRLLGLIGLTALLDRKSTRLNSSHGYISYAVFCLKKKKTESLTLYRLDHHVLLLSMIQSLN